MTALQFFHSHPALGTLILAGEGCYLKVFDAETSTLLLQIKIFEDQAIYGIAVRQIVDPNSVDSNPDIAIWGGLCVAIFTREAFTGLLNSVTGQSNLPKHTDGTWFSENASDWILDGWVSWQAQCFFVTAHNTLLRAKIANGSLILERMQSPKRSILYSAHLAYESMISILVAAGTVFGEIIVWRCVHTIDSSKSRVLHTFTGHEGSIFGVNISDSISDRLGKPARLLASCSDDRTIRIWELDLESGEGGPNLGAIAGRETGFGGKTEQEAAHSKSLAMVMGHASRIWSVQFLLRKSGISILSFGEDATTQLWDLKNTEYLSQEQRFNLIPNKLGILSHQITFAFNTGKHIWSKAIHTLYEKPSLVVTGGADGKVSLLEISDTNVSHSETWDVDAILQDINPQQIASTSQKAELLLDGVQSIEYTQPLNNAHNSEEKDCLAPQASGDPLAKVSKTKPKRIPKDAFNKYAFVSENHVLVTTTFGRILLGEISSSVKWTEVEMPGGSNDLRSYSIVKSILEIGIAFLGSANGMIFLYETGVVKKFGEIEGKVADMFPIASGGARVDLIVTTLGSTRASLFKVGETFKFHDGVLIFDVVVQS